MLPYLSVSKVKTEEKSKINIEFICENKSKLMYTTRNLKDMDK